MLTILICLALIFGFYIGFRRGLLLQLVRFVSLTVTFILATKFYKPLTAIVEMVVPFPSIQPDMHMAFYNEASSFLLDKAFYHVLTFLLISFIGWLLTNFITVIFRPLMYYEVFHSINRIGGGILNFIITYIVLFLILFILSLIPVEFVQQQFVNSPLAYWIISQTPGLSNYILEMWLTINPFNI